MSLLLVLGSFVAADVNRLDSDSWAAREAAQDRLRAFGPFAVPAVADGLASDSPEVRERCRQLFARWSRVWNALRAARVLAAPEPPDADDFFHDHALRQAVFHLADRAGLVLPPVNDWRMWFAVVRPDQMDADELAYVLASLRAQVAERRGP